MIIEEMWGNIIRVQMGVGTDEFCFMDEIKYFSGKWGINLIFSPAEKLISTLWLNE